MDHGITLLAIIHICVALLLITFVLLQDSKGGTGGAFGGGSSQTLFGATGAVNFLVKVTRALAVIFMASCITLAVLMSHRTGHSVTDNMGSIPNPPSTTNGAAPVQPAQGAAAPAAPAAPVVPAQAVPAPAAPAAPPAQTK